MTNIQAQYAKNAAGLERMLAKAEVTGKKVGGYTAEELRGMIADYRALAADNGQIAATRRDLIARRNQALAAGNIEEFQALHRQIVALPMAGVPRIN